MPARERSGAAAGARDRRAPPRRRRHARRRVHRARQPRAEGDQRRGGALCARHTTATHPRKVVDPVCGMELDPAEIAASLDVSGQTAAFCSRDCRQRFVADPQRYAV
ncbi:MAG: YHS domain-containing protein [Acidimicrobiia bacterium]